MKVIRHFQSDDPVLDISYKSILTWRINDQSVAFMLVNPLRDGINNWYWDFIFLFDFQKGTHVNMFLLYCRGTQMDWILFALWASNNSIFHLKRNYSFVHKSTRKTTIITFLLAFLTLIIFSSAIYLCYYEKLYWGYYTPFTEETWSIK